MNPARLKNHAGAIDQLFLPVRIVFATCSRVGRKPAQHSVQVGSSSCLKPPDTCTAVAAFTCPQTEGSEGEDRVAVTVVPLLAAFGRPVIFSGGGHPWRETPRRGW